MKVLIEKTKFVYSEEFYKLDEFDKQKYNKDKMTTEDTLVRYVNCFGERKCSLTTVLETCLPLVSLVLCLAVVDGVVEFPKCGLPKEHA